MRWGLKGISLRKPSEQQLEDCAQVGSRNGPNHFLVGASESFETPTETHLTRRSDGWIEDYDAAQVGEGAETYLKAKTAVQKWQHMSLGWVETNRPPVKLGSSVCIAAKMLFCWQRNPLEVVYVSESDPAPLWPNNVSKTERQGRRYEFGQTTLKGHALAGEERFTVRWKQDNSVWYEVYSFSRAKTLLAVVAYPVRRFFQQKFRRDSIRKLRLEVQQRNSAVY